MPSAKDVAITIAGLYHRYAILGLERRIRGLESGAVSQAQDREDFVLKSRFLTRRAQDPRFGSNVDATAAGSRVEAKNRALIVPAILRSLLSGESATLDSFLDTRVDGEKRYTQKQVQNLRTGKYASLFREVDATAAEDQRIVKMLTVASARPLPAVPETSAAVAEHMADADRHSIDRDDFEAVGIARLTDGRRHQRFAEFRQLLAREMTNPALRENPGFQQAVAYLRPNLMAQEILFNHLESIFATEWFMAKSPSAREDILGADQAAAITPEILAIAVTWLSPAFSEPSLVPRVLYEASQAWFGLGHPEEANVIVSHLLSGKDTEPRMRLGLMENRACNLLHMGRPAEAITAYAEVEEAFVQSGDAYNALIARKNRGEAAFHRGAEAEAAAVFASVRDDGLKLPARRERFLVLANLANAHSRLGLTRQAFQFIGEAMDLAESAEDVLMAGNFHQLIDALPQGVRIGPRAWRRLAKATIRRGQRISGREILAMEQRLWERHDPAFKVTGDASGERGRDDTSAHPEPGAEEAEEE